MEEEDDRSDYGSFRHRPEDVFEFTSDQRRLLGRIATWMILLGVIGLLGSVVMLVLGLLAANPSRGFGDPPREGVNMIAVVIQGFVTLVFSVLTLTAGLGFRRAAWAYSGAGGFLTDALRSLNTLYAFSAILVLLAIGLVAVVVCAGVSNRL
ncbi:MAG TPA: hypothetical protein VEL76_28285 [Gemmataceae bacterium]|nr:hypothetical protein [Gemmataceae bacterium]